MKAKIVKSCEKKKEIRKIRERMIIDKSKGRVTDFNS